MPTAMPICTIPVRDEHSPENLPAKSWKTEEWAVSLIGKIRHTAWNSAWNIAVKIDIVFSSENSEFEVFPPCHNMLRALPALPSFLLEEKKAKETSVIGLCKYFIVCTYGHYVVGDGSPVPTCRLYRSIRQKASANRIAKILYFQKNRGVSASVFCLTGR